MDEHSSVIASGQLATIQQIAAALAEGARPYGGDLRRARGVLLALRAAIHNGSLETLLAAIRPWMVNEVARVDALVVATPDEEIAEHYDELATGVDLVRIAADACAPELAADARAGRGRG